MKNVTRLGIYFTSVFLVMMQVFCLSNEQLIFNTLEGDLNTVRTFGLLWYAHSLKFKPYIIKISRIIDLVIEDPKITLTYIYG